MTITKFQLSNLFHLKKPHKPKSPQKCEEKVLGCLRIQNAVIVLGVWHLVSGCQVLVSGIFYKFILNWLLAFCWILLQLIHLFGFILFISARYLMPDYCSASFYGIEKPSKVVLRDSYIYKIDSSSSVNTSSTNNCESLIIFVFQFLYLFNKFSNFFSKISATYLGLSFLSFIATCFLIRGAAKGKSTFLLPFLLIQIFDILFNL